MLLLICILLIHLMLSLFTKCPLRDDMCPNRKYTYSTKKRLNPISLVWILFNVAHNYNHIAPNPSLTISISLPT